jgi:hypothetical protein
MATPQPDPRLHRWIKTPCGRAQYAELAQRPGALARLRLLWFVLIAALRDWPLPNPDRSENQSQDHSGSSTP